VSLALPSSAVVSPNASSNSNFNRFKREALGHASSVCGGGGAAAAAVAAAAAAAVAAVARRGRDEMDACESWRRRRVAAMAVVALHSNF
jgi:hypothetical protein